MKALKMIALGILGFIGTIIIAVVIALTTLFGYALLLQFIFGREDYLLFVAGEVNMIPVNMIMILIIYFFFRIQNRFLNKKDKHESIQSEESESSDIKSLNKTEKFLFELLYKLFSLDKVLIVTLFDISIVSLNETVFLSIR